MMYPNIFSYPCLPQNINSYFPIIYVNNYSTHVGFYPQTQNPTQSTLKQTDEKNVQIESFPFIKSQSKKQYKSEERKKQTIKSKKKNSIHQQTNKSTSPKGQGKKDQNIFRNILPNIVHQLVIFVQKKSKSKKLVERILKRDGNGDKCSVERFYLYQRFVKEKASHYLNEDILKEYARVQEITCQLFSLEEQKQYLKVSRVLVRYFIKNFMRNSVLTSNRMKPQIKNGHLSILRYLEERINEIYSE